MSRAWTYRTQFDGAMTFTVTAERTESFELVRHMAKEEAPLAALGASPVIILTIAEITFYGHDQTGRSVSTTRIWRWNSETSEIRNSHGMTDRI